MKFTFKTAFLGGELTVETDTLADILGVFTAVEPAKETEEKDPNQMELPFVAAPEPEVVEEVKKVRKPRAKKDEPVVAPEKETNIAGVEIAEEPKVILNLAYEPINPAEVELSGIPTNVEVQTPSGIVIGEEPKTYTTEDLQKAIMGYVDPKAPADIRAARTEEVKKVVLKYSKTTLAKDFPVKKIGDFLKDLEALN